ncbi:phosphatidylserine decarboxylase, partial [Tremellales sp. Uapishka_1]
MSSNPGATSVLPEELGGPLEESLNHLVDHSASPAQARAGADVHAGGGKDVPARRSKRWRRRLVRWDWKFTKRAQWTASEVRADAIHAKGQQSHSWLAKFFPSPETIDKLFSMEHMGNFVIDRQTGQKIFETMPIYVRVGMHLLFVDGCKYMATGSVEKLLENQSIKQGKIYDATGEGVLEHIQSFIATYELSLDELLVKDLAQYPSFNAFFSRRLLPSARPITAPQDPSIITSPADCRMTVFPTIQQAKQIWIKGQKFTIPTLLTGDDESESRFRSIQDDTNASIAIARLAPQDYHRFHSPVEGVIGEIKDIHGELYTVNPQAINEDLNVFTLNKRSVMLIHANFGPGRESLPVAFVAVGAMLVGSIGWSKKPGDKVAKGEELGWFQYGGSTTICVFPSKANVQFDGDILDNSAKSIETLVRVGMEIAKVVIWLDPSSGMTEEECEWNILDIQDPGHNMGVFLRPVTGSDSRHHPSGVTACRGISTRKQDDRGTSAATSLAERREVAVDARAVGKLGMGRPRPRKLDQYERSLCQVCPCPI